MEIKDNGICETDWIDMERPLAPVLVFLVDQDGNEYKALLKADGGYTVKLVV